MQSWFWDCFLQGRPSAMRTCGVCRDKDTEVCNEGTCTILFGQRHGSGYTSGVQTRALATGGLPEPAMHVRHRATQRATGAASIKSKGGICAAGPTADLHLQTMFTRLAPHCRRCVRVRSSGRKPIFKRRGSELRSQDESCSRAARRLHVHRAGGITILLLRLATRCQCAWTPIRLACARIGDSRPKDGMQLCCRSAAW